MWEYIFKKYSERLWILYLKKLKWKNKKIVPFSLSNFSDPRINGTHMFWEIDSGKSKSRTIFFDASRHSRDIFFFTDIRGISDD